MLGEDLNHKIGLVIERQDIFEDRMDSFEDRLDILGNKLESQGDMIGLVNMNLGIVKNDVESIKSSLRRKIDLDDFESLERRVKTLELKTN